MPRRGRPRDLVKVTLKHIRRIENDGWGWHVYFTRRRAPAWKFFADGADGPYDSLKAAVAWRDQRWIELGPARHARERGSKPSSTGVVGVSFEVSESDGRTYEKFRARWTEASGEPGRRNFSINRYGKANRWPSRSSVSSSGADIPNGLRSS